MEGRVTPCRVHSYIAVELTANKLSGAVLVVYQRFSTRAAQIRAFIIIYKSALLANCLILLIPKYTVVTRLNAGCKQRVQRVITPQFW